MEKIQNIPSNSIASNFLTFIESTFDIVTKSYGID
jgi:hypothetical protein